MLSHVLKCMVGVYMSQYDSLVGGGIVTAIRAQTLLKIIHMYNGIMCSETRLSGETFPTGRTGLLWV